LKAEKLSDYFVLNARKIKLESTEANEIRNAIKKAETPIDKIKAIYLQDANFNRSKVAEMLGVSRRYIQQIIKKIEDNEKNA
jgi:predicted regulator of amino acid metabolism with ACT domain